MHRASTAIAIALIACGTGSEPGPWDQLPIDARITAGLEARVDVARDRFGTAHIRAKGYGDLGFVYGFVSAHDRLAQMDVLRRIAQGRLAEVYGLAEDNTLRGEIVDSDLRMRLHRLPDHAAATWAQMTTSTDEDDRTLVTVLERYADGVNRFAQELRDGVWSLDPAIASAFRPEYFEPWEPEHSLLVLRLHTFAYSYAAPFELDLTELHDKLRAKFEPGSPSPDPAIAARRGIAHDLLALAPVGRVATLDGFPNLVTDTGTESDDPTPSARHTSAMPRPTLDAATLDRARAFFGGTAFTSIAAGPLSWLNLGSTSWAVGPSLANGSALLAGDYHAQLRSPNLLYPIHLQAAEPIVDVATGEVVGEELLIDAAGMTLPGVPAFLVGTNGQLAWSITPSQHDATDLYRESIVACPNAPCVSFGGVAVPLVSEDETIQIGHLGQITSSRPAHYEYVPHHGPIIPTISADHSIPPRLPGAEVISVRHTGARPSGELRAMWKLARSGSVESAFEAAATVTHGATSWMLIDSARSIGWTTHAIVPQREDAAYGYSEARPADAAPFFVLDGTGAHEQTGDQVLDRYKPHAIDPAAGFLVTTGADPVGASFDGDPLNERTADDRPLYLGIQYDAGLRQERIASIVAAGGATLDAMAALQHDTYSSLGGKLSPAIMGALAFVDAPSAAPADVVAYLGSRTEAELAQLRRARTLFADWNFETPVVNLDEDRASATTVLFHAWMHFFLEQAIADELAAVLGGFDPWRLGEDHLQRIVFALLVESANLATSTATAQPILCDRLVDTGPDDSCTKLVLTAMQSAMAHLESPPPAGFGTEDTAQWNWGAKHTLAVEPALPGSGLVALPAGTVYQRRGDSSSVGRASHGWNDLDFVETAGPAMRFVAESCDPDTSDRDDCTTARIRTRWQLAGGAILDSRSHHHADLLTEAAAERHFDAPFELADIIANGENRWEFR